MKDLLDRLGWTAPRLARELGIDPETVRQWTKGRRSPPPDIVASLQAAADAAEKVPPLPDHVTAALMVRETEVLAAIAAVFPPEGWGS